MDQFQIDYPIRISGLGVPKTAHFGQNTIRAPALRYRHGFIGVGRMEAKVVSVCLDFQAVSLISKSQLVRVHLSKRTSLKFTEK